MSNHDEQMQRTLRMDAEAAQALANSPDGYAVVMSTGHFVGIWRDRATAELVIKRSPSAKGERIRPMKFVETPQ